MNTDLLHIGKTTITPKLIAIVLMSLLTLVVVTKWLERWADHRLSRRETAANAKRALLQLFRYVAIAIGLIVIVQSVGIDLSPFMVVLGTVGLGIGLALQPLLANFVGGLVLLMERPLKVGDRIEIGGSNGRVMHIGARATNIQTNDNINILVPNSMFTSNQVTNWSHTDHRMRIEVPIGVSYAALPREVEKVLLGVASGHKGVLVDPPPHVLLESFDDSAVMFVLRVWTEEYLETPRILRSELNFAISDALRAKGMEIPFPQRDIHIRSSVLAPSDSATAAAPTPTSGD